MCAQSCSTLHNHMDCSLSGSFVHRIFQARIQEWAAISTPRDLPDPGIKPTSLASPALAGRFLNTAPPGKPWTWAQLEWIQQNLSGINECVNWAVEPYPHLAYIRKYSGTANFLKKKVTRNSRSNKEHYSSNIIESLHYLMRNLTPIMVIESPQAFIFN